jgi:hypothetical protein
MTVGRPAWPTRWPQVNRVVEGLRDGLGQVLGDQLVGLYLSGSLALGGFHPPSSDIDALVATAGVLDEPVVGRLAALHATLRSAGGWAARLEVVTCRSRPCAAMTRATRAATRSRPAVGTWPLAGRARPGCWTAGSPASTTWRSRGLPRAP